MRKIQASIFGISFFLLTAGDVVASWCRFGIPGAAAGTSEEELSYVAEDFPVYSNLTPGRLQYPTKTLQARLANMVARTFQIPSQGAAPGFKFVDIQGGADLKRLYGSSTFTFYGDKREVEMDVTLPYEYQGWMSRGRRKTLDLTPAKYDLFLQRLMDARHDALQNDFAPFVVARSCEESLSTVIGYREQFYSTREQKSIPVSVFLDRRPSLLALGPKIILTAPDFINDLLKDMVERLNEAREKGLPDKRRAFLTSLYAFIQAVPWEQGNNELGDALFAGYYLGLFNKKIGHFLSVTEGIEALTLGQSAFLEAMTEFYGWNP